MIQITYDIQYNGKSYGNDFEKSLLEATKASLIDQINEKFRNVKELENDSVTIIIDLEKEQINVGNVSSEEAKQKIIELLL